MGSIIMVFKVNMVQVISMVVNLSSNTVIPTRGTIIMEPMDNKTSTTLHNSHSKIIL